MGQLTATQIKALTEGGLLIGKVIGVFGFSMLAVKLGLADMPAHASRRPLLGVALLCGIGFTMSIFITLLAFPGSLLLQAEAKIGVLAGSLVAGVLGYVILLTAKKVEAVEAPAVAS